MVKFNVKCRGLLDLSLEEAVILWQSTYYPVGLPLQSMILHSKFWNLWEKIFEINGEFFKAFFSKWEVVTLRDSLPSDSLEWQSIL
jgi:hypothetical protein